MMSKVELFRAAIQAKSDQMNADDLIAAPKTIRITSASIKLGDQPITLSYDGDNGKPYKPCKNMARVIGACLGEDPDLWAGELLTLYCEEEVYYGKDKTGGIRISHASKITTQKKFMLKERGKKKEFIVNPMAASKSQKPVVAPTQPEPIDQKQAMRTAAQALKNAAKNGTTALEMEIELIPKALRDQMTDWISQQREAARIVDKQNAPFEDIPPPDDAPADITNL